VAAAWKGHAASGKATGVIDQPQGRSYPSYVRRSPEDAGAGIKPGQPRSAGRGHCFWVNMTVDVIPSGAIPNRSSGPALAEKEGAMAVPFE